MRSGKLEVLMEALRLKIHTRKGAKKRKKKEEGHVKRLAVI
jgi:hypothetical protein